ncbi:MAG: fibronectin type III domain-containing protein [Clostridia bacterium]|nr:fibronectin type III domain-containing protein [Clostridia bacterium]
MSLGAAEKLKVSPKIKSISVTEDKKLLIKWSKVAGAEKYAVKRAVDPSGDFEHLTWVKKCEFTDETALENSVYWYKITAWKKLDGKKTSTKTSGVKAGIISDIKPPENVSAKAESKKTAITLNWKNRDGADGCVIGRRNDFFSQIVPVAIVEGESFTDEGIVTGQPYHYSLQYFKKDGDSVLYGNFSNEAHCIHLDCGRILSAKSLHGKRAEISLRLVAGADGYIIERSESPDGDFQEIGQTKDGLDLRFYDKVPKAFKAYYYRSVSFKTVNDIIFKSVPSKKVVVKSKI